MADLTGGKRRKCASNPPEKVWKLCRKERVRKAIFVLGFHNWAGNIFWYKQNYFAGDTVVGPKQTTSVNVSNVNLYENGFSKFKFSDRPNNIQQNTQGQNIPW